MRKKNTIAILWTILVSFPPNFGHTSFFDVNQYLLQYLALEYLWSSKGYVRYIFAILSFTSKRDCSWSQKNCFLLHFKSSFSSWDIQILQFYNLQNFNIKKNKIKQGQHNRNFEKFRERAKEQFDPLLI